MSKIPVYNFDGSEQAEYELDDTLLLTGRGEESTHQAVVAFRAGIRQPVASTKSKSEVAGSRKKPWRQKGLGRARSGYKQSPIWVGGGVAFGPKPRSFAKAMAKRMRRLAFQRAFSEKILGDSVRIIESIQLDTPKTKDFATKLKGLNASGKVLIIVDNIDLNLELASRNMQGISVVNAERVCTYELLLHPVIMVTRAAMPIIEERMKRGGKR